MIIYFSVTGSQTTAWIEKDGVRVWEASGDSLADAGQRLIEALANRDDPKAEPKVILKQIGGLEKK